MRNVDFMYLHFIFIKQKYWYKYATKYILNNKEETNWVLFSYLQTTSR